MRFRLHTLGCKVNQYETQYLREGLLQLGYVEASQGDSADLLVVNTCTVTAESDLKSRKLVRKLVKENPGAETVVMGCSVTRTPELWAALDGVTRVLTDKAEIPAFLQQLGLHEPPRGIRSFGPRHRAFVKVQDGCRVGCSYCIIPTVRPVLRSRPENDILHEIRTLVRAGYREIVLTGIHLGHYGLDFPGENRPDLASLVRRIVQTDIAEPFRLRISSLEAVEVSDELIDLAVQFPDKICPHLHLSMQSGSDDVLRGMKRRWLREPFMRRCGEIRTRFDRLALTTDVIVGFPGETDRQFEETCDAVRQLRFSKVHVFRFSPRQGTPAATLPNRVPPEVQRRRAEHLISLSENLRVDFARSLLGTVRPVLLETVHGGTDDRYLEVRLATPGKRDELGRIIPVTVRDLDGDVLLERDPKQPTSQVFAGN